ncbi:MAG: adenylate/guanylate cyclase domain-containing protein, partial [Actinomycetota bacterium]|nr:adenylate/guanylate cyclase domain-containing protein [Actinomycetota bacterium]
MRAQDEPDSTLERYVPRIATEWDQDAVGEMWQELDATLCFVDISGFTNLSERLARRGRIGAEELTGVLNHVFGSMLELAYLQGGSLLKFGGDALLLLFTGHDHAARGASAAVEMRAALRDAASYRTSVGRLRLRMSVGIHTGEIHLFRTGRSHLELVIAGPGGTTTTEMEKTADPGEILVSSGTRGRLPEGAAPTAKGNGWLLKWRKAHCFAPGPIAREPRDPDEVRKWVPAGLRDYLSAGRPEPEHRIATVGFIRFCGVDQMLATEGPETVANALDATIDVTQSAADQEGVTFLATDINEDGGKAILAAGAPLARDEDEGRILRALRLIADTNTPLDLHFGVNRGHVFTGEVGTEYRSTYTVMGDTVNLAARLMAAASAGEIYATPAVLDRSGTLFASEPVEPFRVKGKAEPVHAYEVGEELGERTTDARTELPFVGREVELAGLTAAVTDARAGSGSVVTVVGETGTGKSRLVREACSAVPGVPVISVHAEPYGAASPYRPFRDPMRSALGIERGTHDEMAQALAARVAEIDPDLLPMLPLLGDVAHIEVADTPEVAAIEPRFRRDRLADCVAELLDQVLVEPAVIDVEDAQWMDEASSHLLAHFTATIDRRPWAILVSRRGDSEGFVPDEGRTIELGELTPGEAESLVIEVTTATPLRPHEVKAIVARAGGNPLFLEEVLRVVRETGSTDQLPDSLGTVVSTGIDALSPLTRRILRYASVLGRSFRVETVKAILAGDDLELDAATRRLLNRFLEADGKGRLRFRTAMVRDVAYDSLSFRRRRQLHLRAAEAIEQASVGSSDDAADILAMHYSLGNEHERAWHFARIAADRAKRSYANVEAAAQYERALESVRRLPEISERERALVWTDLGDVREQAGLFDDALDAYRRAYRFVSDDPIAQARLLLKRAGARERAGHYPIALRETTKAKRLVETVDSRAARRWEARATAFAAFVRQRQERPRDALREAEIATEEARAAHEKAALARAYSVMSWAYIMLDMPGAGDLFREALALYEELDDHAGQADVTNNLGGLAYFEGAWDEALAFYERSRVETERLGNVGDVGIVEMNIGEVLVNQRHLDEAERVLRNASRVLRAIGYPFGATFAEMQLGRALTAKGDFEAAEDLLLQVRSEVIDLGFAGGAFESALYLADCLIRKGEADEALTLLDDAAAAGGDETSIYGSTEAWIRASALAALDRREEATDQVRRGLSEARSRGLDYEVALLLQLDAQLASPESPDRAAAALDE